MIVSRASFQEAQFLRFFFFLFLLRRLSASFKKGGFDALSAEAPYVPQGKGAESATSRPISNSYWLRDLDSNQDYQIQSLAAYR